MPWEVGIRRARGDIVLDVMETGEPRKMWKEGLMSWEVTEALGGMWKKWKTTVLKAPEVDVPGVKAK